MQPYTYTTIARFSDTDLYGVVHHSNYFRWIEEARIQVLEELVGVTVDWMENNSLRFPVISVEGKYKKSVSARQPIQIDILLTCGPAAKLSFDYEIKDKNGTLYFAGRTQHAITKDNKLLLKMPEDFEQTIKKKMQDKEEYFITWKN
ncbi:acyl-CoA thioesterase [Butyrivibrio sp. YAB3001]|uniref:acyl-CoA thioesterase n=1 Tax=Butyrivibrio sp. YAB3001 TaxID=1520812 RepID=UPI0008F64A7E|nr:acyl-CoA thioesterase [Butyrivibrio sp. YAB3001]SFC12722.1 acyl-CoA thioester hydrolase [Butyrivibrio sp. YAB3001]